MKKNIRELQQALNIFRDDHNALKEQYKNQKRLIKRIINIKIEYENQLNESNQLNTSNSQYINLYKQKVIETTDLNNEINKIKYIL